MKQVIIARKDLQMSPGKLAAQVSHGSMAFLSRAIRETQFKIPNSDNTAISMVIEFPKEIYDDWFQGSFTKVVCEAKNRNQLMKVVNIAQELGLEENRDYFLIRDNCLTELTPEEIDENGIGRTLTCIGFRPLPDDIAGIISHKYQLFK